MLPTSDKVTVTVMDQDKARPLCNYVWTQAKQEWCPSHNSDQIAPILAMTVESSSVTALALLPYFLGNIRYLIIGTKLYWLEASPRLGLPSGEDSIQLITLGGRDHGGISDSSAYSARFSFQWGHFPMPPGIQRHVEVRTYPGDSILWWKVCTLCLGPNLLIRDLGQFR